MMIASYLERAKRVASMKTASELIAAYPEVARTLKYLGETPLAGAEKIVALHQRHGKEVRGALKEMIKRHSEEIADHSLPSDCLLTIAFDSGHAEPRVEPAKKPFQEEQEKRWETEKVSAKTYRLRRSLKNWRLIFKGDEEFLPDERGVALIEYLLKNPPDEPIHATVLEVAVDGNPVVDGFPDGENGMTNTGGLGGVIQEASGMKLSGKQGVIFGTEIGGVPRVHEQSDTS